MRILLVGDASSPILVRLKKILEIYCGYDVWIVSFNQKTNLNKKIISLGCASCIIDYLKVYKINKIIAELKPDVVHANFINTYGFMSSWHSTPLVIGLWGSDVMIAPNQKNILKKYLYRYINRCTAKKADILYTSSESILKELNRQTKENFSAKTDVFYWGMPLLSPNKEREKEIRENFFINYGIHEKDELIVAPRGLAPIYNPNFLLKIIRRIIVNDHIKAKVVVLKALSSDDQVIQFKRNIADIEDKVIIIDRLLNDDELYVLYGQTKYNISIPFSDALGGGIIEPMLLGSIPILSNINPYNEFFEKYHIGYIIEDESELSLKKLEEFFLHQEKKPMSIGNECFFINLEMDNPFSGDYVVKKIMCLYEKAINKKLLVKSAGI